MLETPLEIYRPMLKTQLPLYILWFRESGIFSSIIVSKKVFFSKEFVMKLNNVRPLEANHDYKGKTF